MLEKITCEKLLQQLSEQAVLIDKVKPLMEASGVLYIDVGPFNVMAIVADEMAQAWLAEVLARTLPYHEPCIIIDSVKDVDYDQLDQEKGDSNVNCPNT